MTWPPVVGLRRFHRLASPVFMAKKSKTAVRPPTRSTPSPPGPIIRLASGQFHLQVCVQPNCAQSALTEVTEDEIRMRLKAPPREGQANLAVINVLAKSLGCSKTDLRIVQGHKGRNKVVEVSGQLADLTSESLLIKIRSVID